jgi:hypothetical protein
VYENVLKSKLYTDELIDKVNGDIGKGVSIVLFIFVIGDVIFDLTEYHSQIWANGLQVELNYYLIAKYSCQRTSINRR